jgi:diguanylate cyclase (GGDEF)-like protein
MRTGQRALFATSAPEKPEGGLSDALLFDVRAHDDEESEAIAQQRLANLRHVPAFLAGAHFICLAIVALQSGGTFAPLGQVALIPVGLALLLDIAGLAVLGLRHRFELRGRSVAISVCALMAAASAMMVYFGHLAAGIEGMSFGPYLVLMLGTAITAAAMAAMLSPALAVATGIVGAVGANLFSTDPTFALAIVVLAIALTLYSTITARTMIDTARERFALDHEAHKALHFVAEFESSGRGWFWETNSLGTLSYVSEQLAEDFACPPDELLGKQFTDLLSVDGGGDIALREERTLGFHLSARFPFSDVIVRAASSEDIHWSLSGNPIFDPRGRFLGFRGIGTDLTEQRRSEQEISRLARFDSLTGLPNRALMRQTLDEALRNASRRQKGCSLFLIDLDRFKNVNDTLGHPVGDLLLRAVADRLKTVMGDHGQVGRLGGDEFKAVLPGTVETGLLESLARTLIEQVSRPYMIEGHRVTIGASVGIAIGDPGRACADSLIRNADLALYAAKAAGRGKHFFYEASMHSEAADRQRLENDLRVALDRDELWVAYQPIVRTAGEEVSGFEALVRWSHPVRGPISPDKFIPLAEECGMIGKIGQFVLASALAEAKKWPEHVRIAVNLSPIQFNDPNIVDLVSEALEVSGVAPPRLELEITEGVFLADSDATEVTFARLKALGVRLALDDFGTGYSSLGYLRKAPFDKIKIDQSFVRGAASMMKRNAAIIRAIVTLAESLSMDTTAEGVETHDDLELMRELGVSQIQGYIFGKPMPGEEAGQLATTSVATADGFQCVREPRHRLMRRAVASVDGHAVEIRLRNISAMGALVESNIPVMPGASITIDIVGVGPVAGIVRWAQTERFGLQFTENFDLGRLAPKQQKANEVVMLQPWYVSKDRAAG